MQMISLLHAFIIIINIIFITERKRKLMEHAAPTHMLFEQGFIRCCSFYKSNQAS
jgi:hypothetical protein